MALFFKTPLVTAAIVYAAVITPRVVRVIVWFVASLALLFLALLALLAESFAIRRHSHLQLYHGSDDRPKYARVESIANS